MDLLQSFLDLKVDVLHFFVCTELQVLFGLPGLIIAKLLELSLKFLDEVLLFEQKFVQRSKL